MITQTDLTDIIVKMKSIYENVKTIEDKNEKMIQTIDVITKKNTPEEERKTKIMPSAYVY